MGTYYKGQRYGSSTVKIQDTGEDGLLQRLIEGTQTEDFVDTRLTTVRTYGFASANANITAIFQNITSLNTCSFFNAKFKKLVLPNLITAGGYNSSDTFQNYGGEIECPALEVINTSCFQYSKITRIYLPALINRTDTWANNMFYDCSYLISADIGDVYEGQMFVRMFGGRVGSMKALILRKQSVIPMVDTNALGTAFNNGTGFVYVPTDLVTSYQSATNWITYDSQIRPFVIASNSADIQTKLNDTNVAVNTLIICDELDYDEGKYTLKIAEGQGEII